MAGVDPVHGAGDAADGLARADRVGAVGAATQVLGDRRDALTDLLRGEGVGAGQWPHQ
jgi:hypothetical protein